MGPLLHPDSFVVDVVVSGEPDDDGVPVETVTQRAWRGCNAKTTGSSENRDSGETVATNMHVSGPLAEWIGSGHSMRRDRDGSVWMVYGTPTHYVAGALDHTELDLIRWEGE